MVAGGRWRCLQYWLRRTRLNLALLEQLDLIGRTAELARAFGIDFFSVLSRGSQYRVESMMVRLAHTQNYLMLSPAKEQVRIPPLTASPVRPLLQDRTAGHHLTCRLAALHPGGYDPHPLQLAKSLYSFATRQTQSLDICSQELTTVFLLAAPSAGCTGLIVLKQLL